jgi:hypothetical protein
MLGPLALQEFEKFHLDTALPGGIPLRGTVARDALVVTAGKSLLDNANIHSHFQFTKFKTPFILLSDSRPRRWFT